VLLLLPSDGGVKLIRKVGLFLVLVLEDEETVEDALLLLKLVLDSLRDAEDFEAALEGVVLLSLDVLFEGVSDFEDMEIFFLAPLLFFLSFFSSCLFSIFLLEGSSGVLLLLPPLLSESRMLPSFKEDVFDSFLSDVIVMMILTPLYF